MQNAMTIADGIVGLIFVVTFNNKKMEIIIESIEPYSFILDFCNPRCKVRCGIVININF
jgi:hypothetical protein